MTDPEVAILPNKSPLAVRRSLVKILVFAIVFAVAAIRANYCVLKPVNSGDVVRNLLYGVVVKEGGFKLADVPLNQINPAWQEVAGAGLPYNYPVLALSFFYLVALLSPTIFFTKVALTVIEAVNSWLIYKTSSQKWLGVIYWCAPVSIWWVSREGQFEPVQNLFSFLGLFFLASRPELAFVALALAIQVKLSAVLLLPFFVYSVWRDRRQKLGICSAVFLLGFLPTVISLGYYPSLHWMSYNPSIFINPYYWDFTNRHIFVWKHPGIIWVRIGNQVASYGILIALLWGAFYFRKWIEYSSSIAFLAICKLHSLIQFWYMILFPSFVLPISHRKWRIWLFLLAPLLDVYSLLQMVWKPFAYVTGYFGPTSVFEQFHYP